MQPCMNIAATSSGVRKTLHCSSLKKIATRTFLTDLKVCAVGGNPYSWYSRERNDLNGETQRRMRSKLDAYNVFTTTVLPGMSPIARPQCPLTMLSQDYETTQSLKRLLAEYLDFQPLKKNACDLSGLLADGGMLQLYVLRFFLQNIYVYISSTCFSRQPDSSNSGESRTAILH